jgi:hypothetical protein
VHEYRRIAIKIGKAIALPFVAKIVVDQGHALVENRQLELRHCGTSPGYGEFDLAGNSGTVSKSCRIGKPALLIISKKSFFYVKSIN